jgi:hypothetical protein
MAKKTTNTPDPGFLPLPYKTVIAIDPSLTSAAIVWGAGRAQDPLGMERITSEAAGQDVNARITRFWKHAQNILEPVARLAEPLVVIEGYSHGHSHQAANLCELGGILRYLIVSDHANLCYVEQAPRIIEVPPTTLKKYITGKGNGDKTPMIAKLAATYGVQFETNDEYDAYGLYLIGLALIGAVAPNMAQRAELAKLLTVKAPKGKKRKKGKTDGSEE